LRQTILVGVAIVLALAAPVGWHYAFRALEPVTVGPEPATRAELAALRTELADLRDRLGGLEGRIGTLDPKTPETTYTDPGQISSEGLKDSFAGTVLIAGRREINSGLSHASPDFLKELLGLPREDLTDDCNLEMTNEKLAEMLVVDDVGPINVRMLRPAILSLKQIFKDIEVYEPELYTRIRSSGSLCVRLIRGSDDTASAHAYGLAVDINIDGHLDTLGDGKSQLGLILVSEFFQKAGWYWGAGFGREDSMHFEVSREKLEQWRRLGQI
jgi:hypothetical protein